MASARKHKERSSRKNRNSRIPVDMFARYAWRVSQAKAIRMIADADDEAEEK